MEYACADSGGAAKSGSRRDSSKIDRRMMFLVTEVIVIAKRSLGSTLVAYTSRYASER